MFKTCIACGDVSLYRKKKCGDCLVTRYCDRECQKNHWSEHKSECLELCEYGCRQETLYKLSRVGIYLSNDIGGGVKLRLGNYIENEYLCNDDTMSTELFNHKKMLSNLLYILKDMPKFVCATTRDIRTGTNEIKNALQNEICKSFKSVLDSYVTLPCNFAKLVELCECELVAFQCGKYMFEITKVSDDTDHIGIVTVGSVQLKIQTFHLPSGAKLQNESVNDVVDSLKESICKIFVCD